MSEESIFKAFKAAMIEAGFGAPHTIIGDGNIQRFSGPGDKPSRENAWYVLHLGDDPHGRFGNWRLGKEQIWSAPRELLSPKLRERLRQTMEAMTKNTKESRAQLHAETQKRAADVWQGCTPALPEHPYLVAKQVQPHGLRQTLDVLVVPLYDVDLELFNLQQIYPFGKKVFLIGGRVKGTFSPIGSMEGSDNLIICEGWATGATLHEETGRLVLAAMTAGNLLPVALAVRQKWPAVKIIIAADNDRKTPGNPGVTAGRAAANAVDGKLTFPPFADDEPGSDFNDWCILHAGDEA